MRKLLVSMVFVSACSSSAVTPTTVAPQVRKTTMQYSINVPYNNVALNLKLQYPDGVLLSPIAAQGQFNYTDAYGGTPNVYYGETSPKCQTYFGAGIVIAPRRVASVPEFVSTDWPGIGLEPGVTYIWQGHFVYAEPAPAGTAVFDPACL